MADTQSFTGRIDAVGWNHANSVPEGVRVIGGLHRRPRHFGRRYGTAMAKVEIIRAKVLSGGCYKRSMEKAGMGENRLRFSEIPHTNRLFIDFLCHFDRVKEFYSDACRSPHSLQELASKIAGRYELRSLLIDVLRNQNEKFGGSRETFKAIERLAEPNAVAIVTGQQTGLFTGPLFTIYKAITAIKWCDLLCQQGINAVPLFWINSDDHDFDEVNHCGLVGRGGEWVEIRYTTSDEDLGKPVGEIHLGGEINEVVASFLAALPRSESIPTIEADLRSSYVEGARFVEGFARLLARVFSGSGVILLDPSVERLKRAVADVHKQAIVSWQEIALALHEQTERLVSLGYRPQIHMSADSGLVFTVENGKRRAIVRKDGRFCLKGSETVLAEDELLTLIAEQPQLFSPNVALRPIVQDTLLPTLAYIGGPNEVAYFAQLKPLYETFGKIQPLLLPRASLTLVEKRYAKTMEKHGLKFQDLFIGIEGVVEKATAKALGESQVIVFDEARNTIAAQLERLRLLLAGLDPTLNHAASRAEEKMLHQIEGLRKHYLEARARRDQTTSNHIKRLISVLYPKKKLQEREMNAFYFFSRYGYGLIQQLYDAIEVGGSDHELLYL